MTSQIYIMISMIVYMAFVLGIGIWCSKRNKTTDDFYLGGRRLGPLVTAMSAEASDMSSWLLMGLPGVAYLTGSAEAFWTAAGLAIGTYVNWLIVAKRIRLYTYKTRSATIPEFFANRFRDRSGAIMVVAALVIIIFFVPYTASGFSACGKLFSSLFGFDYFWSMIISAAVIVAYTTIGGFLAASTTDFVQSIIMTVALITVLGFGTSVAGGFNAVMENARSMGDYLSLTSTFNVATRESGAFGPLAIVSTLAWGLGYFGMPHILLRFMAIEDAKKLKLSRRIASIWVVISMGVAILIGIIGYGMTSAGAVELLDTSGTAETIIVKIAGLLAENGAFAALVAGVILAGILAATMSTADSQLLAAASSVSQNIIAPFAKKEFSAKTNMLIARITVIAISAVAIVLASDPNASVFRVVSFAWAGFGAAFGPVVLFSLFWKRTTLAGALSGMITGGAMVFIWKYGIAKLGGVFAIYELLPAFLAACLVIVLVSLLTKAPVKEITDEFDEVKTMQA